MNPNRFQHILAAVDFSAAALPTAQMAAREAALHGAQLTLIHIVNPQIVTLQLPEDILPPMLDMRGRLLELAQKEMAKLAAKLPTLTPPLDWAVEESADRMGMAVIHWGTAHGVDLIVVGSHGHGAIGRLLLGSVANDIVHHARCPVLVMKVKAE